jgi:hypothetical protein
MKRTLLRLSLLTLAVWACNLLAQTPTVTVIGPEEFVSDSNMEHPSVATDSKAQPHMVGDFGVGNSFMKYHRVKGKWSGGVFATGQRGGRYDASRLYIGQIEIDRFDRAWISCKFGVKEYGDMYGQGLWLFKDVDQTAWPAEQFFRFVCVYKGMGLISTDAKYPNEGVMLGTFGNWEKISHYGQTLGKGSFGIGHGGEKIRFRIASYAPRFSTSGSYPDGIWHNAMNGFSGSPSQYQNSLRKNAGYGPVPWAAYGAYPRMSDDYCHPGIGIDLVNPKICYIGSVFSRGLVVNIWNGERMLFNPYSLKTIDYEADFEGRLGAQFAPALSGGTFVFWSADNVIKMCFLTSSGYSSPHRIVTAGRSPGVTTDRYGNIHLVYYNGGIRYRKIQVTTLRPIDPQDKVSTRTPRFRWTSTQASLYTIQLKRDGVNLPVQTCPSNSWRPSEDLKVGNYSWKVKEGKPDNKNQWSRALAFEVPPEIPVPVSPDSRYPTAPIKPVLSWKNADPQANQFLLQMFKGDTLLGTRTVTGDLTSFKWPTPLEAGDYTWRIKAARAKTGHNVSSTWSAPTAFQVAVPGLVQITEPQRLETFNPGWQTVTCNWTSAEGVDSHTLKLLYNGDLIEKIESIKASRYDLTKAFQPGYYSLVVKAVNSYGTGPWSPVRTFIVKRQMIPGGGQTLAAAPRALEWTRNRNTTRYLVKVARYDRSARKYRVIREKWVAQPTRGEPLWKPSHDLMPVGSYRWSVTDYNGKKQGYTSVDYFQVRVPGVPRLLSPLGDVAGHRQLAFNWEDPSAFAEDFQLQVGKNKDIVKEIDWTSAALVRAKDTLFLKAFSLEDASAGTYWWRVRGRNDYGMSPWKQGSFVLAPLAAPVVTEPEDGDSGPVGTPVVISWEPVGSATRYEAAVVSGDVTLESQEVAGTNWVWTPSTPGAFTIQVRAGETGWSRWTSVPFTAY